MHLSEGGVEGRGISIFVLERETIGKLKTVKAMLTFEWVAVMLAFICYTLTDVQGQQMQSSIVNAQLLNAVSNALVSMLEREMGEPQSSRDRYIARG